MALRFCDSFVPSKRSPSPASGVAVRAVIAAIAIAGSPAHALTSVDCDSPDDFCTGDPCETADSIMVTVQSCTLDFSPRTLVIANKVFLPNDGALSLTAGAIEVEAKIDGRHTDSDIQADADNTGGDVRLSAVTNALVGISSTSDLVVTGDFAGGVLEATAGGNLTAQGDFEAQVGGCIGLSAGGTLDTSGADFDVPLTASCP